MSAPTSHSLAKRYNSMSRRATSQVIAEYSSSFSLASRLLSRQVRTDIYNLYAVVRIADEIVDGAAEQAGQSRQDIERALDAYEDSVLTAADTQFHTDPVLHAFAQTARRCGFRRDYLAAFL